MLLNFGISGARVGDDVGDDPHRGFGRVDIGVADRELFQDVVLDRAARACSRGDALLLAGDDVEGHHRQHRAVHRHADRHLVRAGCRRTAASCPRRCRSPRPPCRRRRRRADGRCHSRGGWRDRRRPTAPSALRRGCGGRRRCSPRRSRSRHIGGWSRAARRTWSHRARGCRAAGRESRCRYAPASSGP